MPPRPIPPPAHPAEAGHRRPDELTDELTQELERRLRQVAERHSAWLRYVRPISACGFGVADLYFTGDISSLDRCWLAVHLALLAESLTRGLREASGRSRRCGRSGRSVHRAFPRAGTTGAQNFGVSRRPGRRRTRPPTTGSSSS